MESNSQKSLFKNSLFSICRTFCRAAFPAITFSYASRILGETGIGRVSFARSIVSYFSILALLGINGYGTREIAKRRTDRTACSRFTHEMLLINGCTTAAAYILLFLTALTVPKLHGYGELLMICSAVIVLNGLGMEWLYQGLEEYRYITIRSIAFEVLALLVLLLFVHDAGDAAVYAAVTVLASEGSYILNFFHARKYIDWKWYGGYRLKRHLRPILQLFAVAVSVELYTVLDSTMLGFLRDDAAVGRYAAAVKVTSIIIMMITAVSTVMVPRMAFYIGRGEREQVEELPHKAYNYIFMLSVPAAIGLFLLSDEVIRLFGGSGFSSAALTMRILTPLLVVRTFSSVSSQILVPMGKEKLLLCATLTGAVTNFTCNLILIPRFAENGAAAASVVAETAVAAVSFLSVNKYFDMKKAFHDHWQYWLAAAPIPFIVSLAKALPIHYIGQIAIAVAVSAGCYFALLFGQKNVYFMQALQKLQIKEKCK